MHAVNCTCVIAAMEKEIVTGTLIAIGACIVGIITAGVCTLRLRLELGMQPMIAANLNIKTNCESNIRNLCR